MIPATPAEELRGLADSITTMTEKLQRTPGLIEGHIERIGVAVEQILRDYGGASYRQYRNLVRDLDAVAAEVARHSKARTIAPKVLRTFDAALLRIRKRDFFTGRRLVDKLGKLRAQARERDRMLAEYREGFRAIEREIARLRTERARLKSVRRPSMSESEVDAVKGLFEEVNRALVRAWVSEMHEIPCRTSIETLLEASRDRRLLLPLVPEADARILLDLLSADGPTGAVFGGRGIHGLLEALSYSDAKLAHLVGDGRPMKAALHANLPWLKAITAPGEPLPRLSLDPPLDDLTDRVEALSAFADRLHAASDARARLGDVRRGLASGEIARSQEADRAYRAHGDAARMSWNGTLDSVVEDLENKIDARTRDLRDLVAPEKLG